MSTDSWTLQDVLCYKTKANNKKIDRDLILPFVILPISLGIASVSWPMTIIVMIGIMMGLLYVSSRPQKKIRSQFFLAWTLSSAAYLFLIFEIDIVTLFLFTQLEHFVLLFLIACTFYCFYKVNSIADFELSMGASKGKDYSPVLTADSYYCYICQIEVNDRYFHSIWLDSCIFKPNYPYFLTGLILSFATLVYGANLGLTAVCASYLYHFNILLPKDCSDTYYAYDIALCFVTSIYALGYAVVIAIVLIQQIFLLLTKYTKLLGRKCINVSTV